MKSTLKTIIIATLLLWASASTVSAVINLTGYPTTKLDAPKMEWWKEAKFGMFIHWGLYSVPAGTWGSKTGYGEWIMNSAKIPVSTYAALAKEFNPTNFNAEDWVKLAQAAGQKYIVFTTKHHEGFAMFNSKVSHFNIVDATPFKRDIVKELADACHRNSVRLGFYYSQSQDWHQPGGAATFGHWDDAQNGEMQDYASKIAIPQVKEILSNYGKVDVLWWDTPRDMPPNIARQFAEIVKPYPELITNNRLGEGVDCDILTPEQTVPSMGYPGCNWETCMTMNGHWGYNASDKNWKSTEILLCKLIEIVSKGGNFLLNVGPDRYGVIPEVCRSRLLEIGEWMKVNGESIYGTRASPFLHLPWGRATRKGQTLYLHVLDWPKDGRLMVPLSSPVTKAYLLADAKKQLSVEAGKECSTIILPNAAPDKIASVVALDFTGEFVVPSPPSQGKKVVASSSDGVHVAAHLTDGILTNRWQAAKGQNSAWLEMDLGRPTAVQRLTLMDPWHSGYLKIIQDYDFGWWTGNEWKSIVKGKINGLGAVAEFAPVTGNRFRLYLENKAGEPSLNQWILSAAP